MAGVSSVNLSIRSGMDIYRSPIVWQLAVGLQAVAEKIPGVILEISEKGYQAAQSLKIAQIIETTVMPSSDSKPSADRDLRRHEPYRDVRRQRKTDSGVVGENLDLFG